MTTVWKRIDCELHRRRMTWADPGRVIDVSDQAMNNWSRREVPAKRYAEIARVFGWTIEQLMGESEPAAPEPVEPEREYSKRAADLAELFDELKDPEVRRKVYTTMMGFLQMAKASQQAPSPKAG